MKSQEVSYRPQHYQFIDPDSLLGEAQTAEMLAVTPRALQAWRQRGGGPAFVRISSRCVRYRRRDVVAWAEARQQASNPKARTTTTKN